MRGSREFAWCQAGKFAKLIYEVGLIIIAAFERHLCPVGRALFTRMGQRLAESEHSCKALRRKARSFEANPAKLPGAQTGRIGEFLYRNLPAIFDQPCKRPFDGIERRCLTQGGLDPADGLAR